MAIPEFTPEELAAEEWRDVVGYKAIYSVSNLGRVRRDVDPISRGGGAKAGTILKGSVTFYGYLSVNLSLNKVKHPITVHRLVMFAFVGPCPENHNVNHLDGIKINNRVANLEYVTPKQNMEHASRMGLVATGDRQGLRLHPEAVVRGERHWKHKLTEDQVRAIRREHAITRAPSKLAARYNVSTQTIWRIVRKTHWTHI